MPRGKPDDGIPPNRLGSKARCDKLIAMVSETESLRPGYIFILTAGFTKESPASPTQKVWESLSGQMERYLLSQGVQPKKIFAQERSWGTHEETVEAIKLITKMAEPPQHLRFNPHIDIYVSTNLGHIPRVWLCWYFLKPKKWKVHFVRANHSFTPKEYFQETAKFFGYLYKFLFNKW